jgi:hypothetical protein
MKFIWKYYIPLLVIALGILTMSGDPNQPILKSVPIVPGQHQVEIATAFIVFGLLLGVIVFIYEKKKSEQGDTKKNEPK